MQIVIEIAKDQYEIVKQHSGSYDFGYAIANGTVLPENCEILTKEAYADLCYKAAGLESGGKE